MPRKKKTDKQTADEKMKEFSSAIMQIAEEKGIPKNKVIETVEMALAAAYKKDYGKKSQHIRADFDEVTGNAKFYLVKEVVDETTREFATENEDKEQGTRNSEQGIANKKLEAANSEQKTAGDKQEQDEEERLPRFNPERDITLEDAKKIKKGIKVGDVIETELEPKSEYGRIAAQTAKQVIIQRIREAERDAMFEEYKEKEGEIVSGTVQRIEGRNVFVDLGKSAGVLFPSEQVAEENYRVGQRLKVYILKVEADPKGPGIILSRAHAEMVKKLFELEVPEIFSGVVEIKAIAREAGARTKIAVVSKEEGVDPIGSCVGQKGTRVQAIIDELGGEKIDIIEWNDDIEKFISAALSPAKVISIETDKDEKRAVVKVPEDQLSLAIGKKGQNVRLAAKLTGWKIDVMGMEGELKEEEVSDKKESINDKQKEASNEDEQSAGSEKEAASSKQKKQDKEKSGKQ